MRRCRASEAELWRSGEHTPGLQSHRDLHSFPTRRSSDLSAGAMNQRSSSSGFVTAAHSSASDAAMSRVRSRAVEIGRAHAWTPVTPRSTLFPYTTLFRSLCRRDEPAVKLVRLRDGGPQLGF